MTETHRCESCSMPIETGRFCQYCTDESGALQSFEQRLSRMMTWQAHQSPEANPAELEHATLEFMAKMPAWKDNPELLARLGKTGRA